MNKYKNFFRIVAISFLTTTWAGLAQAQYLSAFPGQCAFASDRIPLDGHILRLGKVGWTHYGWSLFFPDQNIGGGLNRVGIAPNVGIVGQHPGQNISEYIHRTTPDGSFVVAHIFVADQNSEPVVTCISPPSSINNFSPSYFGASWRWLSPDTFRILLGRKVYSKWNWRHRWGRDFDDIRRKFRGFGKGDYGRRRDRDRDDDDGRRWFPKKIDWETKRDEDRRRWRHKRVDDDQDYPGGDPRRKLDIDRIGRGRKFDKKIDYDRDGDGDRSGRWKVIQRGRGALDDTKLRVFKKGDRPDKPKHINGKKRDRDN